MVQQSLQPILSAQHSLLCHAVTNALLTRHSLLHHLHVHQCFYAITSGTLASLLKPVLLDDVPAHALHASLTDLVHFTECTEYPTTTPRPRPLSLSILPRRLPSNPSTPALKLSLPTPPALASLFTSTVLATYAAIFTRLTTLLHARASLSQLFTAAAAHRDRSRTARLTPTEKHTLRFRVEADAFLAAIAHAVHALGLARARADLLDALRRAAARHDDLAASAPLDAREIARAHESYLARCKRVLLLSPCAPSPHATASATAARGDDDDDDDVVTGRASAALDALLERVVGTARGLVRHEREVGVDWELMEQRRRGGQERGGGGGGGRAQEGEIRRSREAEAFWLGWVGVRRDFVRACEEMVGGKAEEVAGGAGGEVEAGVVVWSGFLGLVGGGGGGDGGGDRDGDRVGELGDSSDE